MGDKTILAQQKFLKEIFAELPKFCLEPHLGSGRTRTELYSGTELHFAFFLLRRILLWRKIFLCARGEIRTLMGKTP